MLEVVEDKIKTPKTATAGSGSGGDDTSNLEKRVDRLEIKVDKIDGRLDKIERILYEIQIDLKHKASKEDIARIEAKLESKASKEDITRIEAKLETKASAVELAEVKGRITQIPNTWQLMLGLIGFAGFIFAIVKFVK